MMALLGNRWGELAVLGIGMTLVGIICSARLLSRGPSGPTLGPVKLTAGGSVTLTGDTSGQAKWATRQIKEEDLPLTAAEAVAAGWEDPILCSVGRGRYFKKAGDVEAPYLLMYDAADRLTGMYMVSQTEMPLPWELTEEISGGAGAVLDYEHWGLFVYFRDPLKACTPLQGGCGYALCR